MIDLLLEVNHAMQSNMMNLKDTVKQQSETIAQFESRLEDVERDIAS